MERQTIKKILITALEVMSRHVTKESREQMIKNIDGMAVRCIGIILESQAAEQNQFHADAPKLERERVSEAESITVSDPIALERPRGGRSIAKHSYRVPSTSRNTVRTTGRFC